MKIRTKFALFLLPIHLAGLALCYMLFRENRLFFIFAEMAIVGSYLLCFLSFRSVSRPLQLLLTGLDAIRDRDFNVKFVQTGQYETDQLIGVYNEMIDRLREERTRQEQQHFFLDKLIQTSPTGIIILDYDGTLVPLEPHPDLAVLPDDIKELLFDQLGWSDREHSKRFGGAAWELLWLMTERTLMGNGSIAIESSFFIEPTSRKLAEWRAMRALRIVELHCTADRRLLVQRLPI